MIEALLPDGRRILLENPLSVLRVHEPAVTTGAYSLIDSPASFPQIWTLRLMGVDNGLALYALGLPNVADLAASAVAGRAGKTRPDRGGALRRCACTRAAAVEDGAPRREPPLVPGQGE